MPDDDRAKLEAPQLFGRRRRRARDAVAEDTTAVSGTDTGTAGATDTGAADTADSDSAFEALFADSGRDEPDATAVLPTTPASSVDVVDPPDSADPDTTTGTPASAKRRRTPREGPLLPGRPAAVLTGLVVGLALLGFTWVGFRACEATMGTTSCGTAPGMAALVVIFVLAVTVGGLLLSRFEIPDPGATSFLGTGLTAVVYLLAVDYLDNWTVLVVVPVVTALTFLLAWFVTTAFVEVD